ncbi:tyrosine phosphatase family protein [Chelatococcus sp. SYSU_G07232]|uniref:Tyrosine phosphatase family protein n=1 Tax=Chelatococcus albus TaxID=3047466 RepID=A0ABT7AEI2_9HYPH|nr:tyrosine phosphatase family protein [Chelatococcus sp. SYSU_G07232]MDJ1157763.1 tyrosine phosphatase family protein [Chelatococcus sp. SYSU_G07232]
MSTLHVCPLSRLASTVALTGASHIVTLINMGTPVERPASIPVSRHLFIGVSDITEPLEGHVLPGEEHVTRLLDFVHGWEREKPLVVHCYAGISRSTAAAFITACALSPTRDEQAIAETLRRASPTATPNPRLVATADALLGRDGRMVAAIASIGRGAEAFEGEPFMLPLA